MGVSWDDGTNGGPIFPRTLSDDLIICTETGREVGCRITVIQTSTHEQWQNGKRAEGWVTFILLFVSDLEPAPMIGCHRQEDGFGGTGVGADERREKMRSCIGDGE